MPLPFPAPAAETAVRPAWQPFADELLGRLREQHDGRKPVESHRKAGDDGDVAPDRDAFGASGSDGDLLPKADNPVPIPARRLLTCLRLAASFGARDALLPLRAPGALSVLRGIDVADLDLVVELLRDLLPDQGWAVAKPAVLEDAVSKPSEQQFLRHLVRLLDAAKPVLVLQPLGVSLPDFLRQPGVTTLSFAPVSAEILLAHLAAQGRAPDDEAAFRLALPEPSVLARLDSVQTCAALRLGSGADLADGLNAMTGPAAEGPHLDKGFSDSPAVRVARRLVADLAEWQRGGIAWSDFSHSLLLYGGPGAGKTWLARAMGNSAGIGCVTGSFAEWQSAGHLGDMLREMRRTFAMARRAAPAILFIDEIDAIGSRSDDDHHNRNYRIQVINAFLGEMNALATEPGVIVVGACNHPDRIDPAVTRAGRFDLKVEVPMPDAEAILALLQQLKGSLPDEDLRQFARQAVGHSLASIDAAIRAARSEARHSGRPLDLAMLQGQLRLEVAQEADAILWRYAIHEAGHAVVCAALRLGRIERMAISAKGGEVASRPILRQDLLSDMENEICHDLAGRAAEALVFGAASAGSGGPTASDLSRATRRALAIETVWGLGDLGPLWLPAPETVLLTDEPLRARVRGRLEAAEARAAEILTTHMAQLLGLARELVEKRSMRAEEILPWVEAVQAQTKDASGDPDRLSEED